MNNKTILNSAIVSYEELLRSRCRFQNVLLVSVKFFPSLARAGLVEELRHLYVVVILWSGACARSKILR